MRYSTQRKQICRGTLIRVFLLNFTQFKLIETMLRYTIVEYAIMFFIVANLD